MIERERITLAGPRQPSGITWLVNCFLEIEVLSYVASEQRMWSIDEGIHVLRDNKFKKWLPILSRQDRFNFRQDVEIEWTHDFPVKRHHYLTNILFVRDPRDALWSQYKRDQVNIPFIEYLRMLEPDTGVNKISTWRMFCDSWLRVPDVTVLRFEDSKVDPIGTLGKAIKAVGMTIDLEQVKKAVENSTFDKAQVAEAAFRSIDKDPRVANRLGTPGEWRTMLSTEANAMELITHETEDVLKVFNYSINNHTNL